MEAAAASCGMKMNIPQIVAVLEQAGIPALRAAFSAATIVFLWVGAFLWRKRHQFFDRDPNVDGDVPVVRHNRAEAILIVWGGLTIVLLTILYQMWSV